MLLGIAFLACPKAARRDIKLRTIGGGLLLLLLMAVLVLKTPVSGLFSLANGGVERMLGFTREGAKFVFGGLSIDQERFGFLFAFQVLPTILFFSALMSVLYYLGVMPWIVERGGRLLSRALRVSGAESFSTVADVFVGQTEAPLAVRPYLSKMTLSELHACMVAGFATTAGGVLAAYSAMLSKSVPGIAGHLIAASVMSAPASLVIAKLMLPERETPETTGELQAAAEGESANLLDAVTRGTIDGVRLAVNVAAMLIVFLTFTALFDAVLSWAGSLFGIDLSLSRISSWVFWPLSFALGVPASDAGKVATLLGQKTVFNEFVAYSSMAENLARDPTWLSERGRPDRELRAVRLANFGSIGIQIGGYASLAPERRADLSRLGFRAMVGGLLTTCLVACVAAMLL